MAADQEGLVTELVSEAKRLGWVTVTVETSPGSVVLRFIPLTAL